MLVEVVGDGMDASDDRLGGVVDVTTNTSASLQQGGSEGLEILEKEMEYHWGWCCP